MESKWEICPSCEGDGGHGPGFVYVQSDVDEQFADVDEFRDHLRDIKRGVFDTPCDWCEGRRVVKSGKSGNSDAWREWCEYQAEVAAEGRYFGHMR